jgi:hypothetical protein
MARKNNWLRLLGYVTGLVNQEHRGAAWPRLIEPETVVEP